MKFQMKVHKDELAKAMCQANPQISKAAIARLIMKHFDIDSKGHATLYMEFDESAE